MKKLPNTQKHSPAFYVVIPARYSSTRLPGKPLLDIAGKPMVVHVADRARLSGAVHTIIATDDLRIVEAAKQHGYYAMLTRADHVSSTEAVMATACHGIQAKPDFINPNIVKVVVDKQGHALYFSRAPIPYPRDTFAKNAELPADMPVYRHIGIYAYRASFLKQYADLTPAAIEHYESLEQLRVLYHGYKIAVAVTENAPATGVDTEADLTFVRSVMTNSCI